MRYLLVLLILSGCTTAQVSHVTYATALATLTMDHAQTRYIALHPDERMETNPILTKHPTTSQVDTYFRSVIGLTAVSYPLLQDNARPWVYGAITILESVMIARNFKHGLQVNFDIFHF